MADMLNEWIVKSGINPIVFGWLGALMVLALIGRWRGK